MAFCIAASEQKWASGSGIPVVLYSHSMALWDVSLWWNVLQKWKVQRKGLARNHCLQALSAADIQEVCAPHLRLAVKGNYDNEEWLIAEVDQP